jgi:hypothetical protein
VPAPQSDDRLPAIKKRRQVHVLGQDRRLPALSSDRDYATAIRRIRRAAGNDATRTTIPRPCTERPGFRQADCPLPAAIPSISSKRDAPRSPWQNGYVERLIGSIRRASLDHLIVIDEAQLRRVLKNYASYCNRVRTHLSLNKNAPHFRRPQKLGHIAISADSIINMSGFRF